MYLRTTKRRNRDGSTTSYYQLAHNERHPVTGKSTAKVIHSFGRADKLDRDALVRLCRSIAKVCGVEVIDPFGKETPQGGLPGDIRIVKTVEYGVVKVVEELWEQYGIGRILRKAVGENKQIPHDKALLAMVANRLCNLCFLHNRNPQSCNQEFPTIAT